MCCNGQALCHTIKTSEEVFFRQRFHPWVCNTSIPVRLLYITKKNPFPGILSSFIQLEERTRKLSWFSSGLVRDPLKWSGVKAALPVGEADVDMRPVRLWVRGTVRVNPVEVHGLLFVHGVTADPHWRPHSHHDVAHGTAKLTHHGLHRGHRCSHQGPPPACGWGQQPGFKNQLRSLSTK